MKTLPRIVKGNGSLGTTAALVIIFALMIIPVYLLAKELVGWYGLAVVFLLVLYGAIAKKSRRLGGILTRY